MNTKQATSGVDALELVPRVILATGQLSAGDAAKAKARGSVALPSSKGGLAYLEFGGIVIAEGRIKRRGGQDEFVVEKLYRGENP